MNVSEAIRMKRAVRKFQDKPLPDEVSRAILNAGRGSFIAFEHDFILFHINSYAFTSTERP